MGLRRGSQSKLDAMTGQVLQTLGGDEAGAAGAGAGVPAGSGAVWQGVIDRDAVLQHLEEHLAELSRLLERSEDAVLLELEQERERVTEALRRQHPEIASYLAAHREELGAAVPAEDIRRRPGTVHELRQRLHQLPDEETKEQR